MDNQPKPPEEEGKNPKPRSLDELLPLFRLLTREPPKDHDFTTCPVCKRYGITEI